MTSRRIEDLHPAVRGRCRRLIALCEGRGINVIITSTLRTEAEQLALFAQGRKALKTVNEFRAEAGLPPISGEQNRVVTNAATSVHQFGLAFDVAIIRPPHPPLDKGGVREGISSSIGKGHGGGEAVWDVKADINADGIADYEEVGLIGEFLGLQWGGRFRLRDYCHFQFTGGLSLKELIAGKRPETHLSPPWQGGAEEASKAFPNPSLEEADEKAESPNPTLEEEGAGGFEIKPAICHGSEGGGLSWRCSCSWGYTASRAGWARGSSRPSSGRPRLSAPRPSP